MSIIVKAKYKKGLFAKKISIENFMETLGKINVEKEYKAELIRYSNNQFVMSLLPGGAIQFNVTDNLMEISSQTSLVGPGFHKCVIEIIEELGARMGLHFDITDPTDYDGTRAFMMLQKEHINDVREIFTEIVKAREEKTVEGSNFVGWRNKWFPLRQKEIITSYGSFSVAEIKEILASDSFDEFAKSQIFWFDETKTAQYYKQTALFYLWNGYRWRKPITKEDARISQLILHSLEMARMADNDIPLPSQAWQQICAYTGVPYLNLNEAADIDDSNIGYLKYPVHFHLPLDYGLKLPGSFEMGHDQEGFIVLSDPNRIIKIKIAPEMQPGHVMDPRKMLEEIDYQEEINGSIYVAQITDAKVSGGSIYMLHGYIQSYASYAEVNIVLRNTEDKSWALNALKAIEVPFTRPISLASLDQQ